MKQLPIFVLCAILFVILTACAPGTSVQVNTPNDTMQLSAPGVNPLTNQGDMSGRVARAGAGLWHGIIAPITLVLSFFSSDIRMYEVHNAGAEYDLGFLLGVGLIFLVLGVLIRMRR
jgi:hypothetical protein